MKKILLILLPLLLLNTVGLSQNQNNLRNKYRLAQSYERSGNYEKAGSIYRELLKTQPWNFQYLQGLNNIFIIQKKYDESISLLNERIKANNRDLNSYGLLGSTYYISGDYERAYETWQKGIDVNPASLTSYRTIANYAIENRAFDKAVEYLNEAKTVSKKKSTYAFDLAQIFSITMKFEEAATEYCYILLENPQQVSQVQSRIARYLSSEEAPEKTIKVVKKFYDENEDPVFMNLLLYLYRYTERFDEAFDIVGKLEEIKESGGSQLYGFAHQVFNEKHYEVSARAYRMFIEKYKESSLLPNAKIGLARSMEMTLTEKVDSANNKSWLEFTMHDTTGAFLFSPILKEYETLGQILRNNEPWFESLFRQAEIYLTRFNEINKADSLYSIIIQKGPYSSFYIPSKFREAEIASGRNDFAEVKKQLEEIIKFPRSDNKAKNRASFLMARLKFWMNDFEAAVQLLDNFSNSMKDDYANNAISLKMMITALRQDSLTLASFAKADLLAETGNLNAAAEEYRLIYLNKNVFLYRDYAGYLYAELLAAQGEYNKSVEILTEISAAESSLPFSDKSLFLLGNIYNFGLDNKAKAKESYENLLENFPNSLYFNRSRFFINSISN